MAQILILLIIVVLGRILYMDRGTRSLNWGRELRSLCALGNWEAWQEVGSSTPNSHTNLLVFLIGAENLRAVSGARMIRLPLCLRSQESSEARNSFILSSYLLC
jgi:hypothetical protein